MYTNNDMISLLDIIRLAMDDWGAISIDGSIEDWAEYLADTILLAVKQGQIKELQLKGGKP